jgi:hypothetical protein
MVDFTQHFVDKCRMLWMASGVVSGAFLDTLPLIRWNLLIYNKYPAHPPEDEIRVATEPLDALGGIPSGKTLVDHPFFKPIFP